MQTREQSPPKPRLGEVVEAAYALGSLVAATDRETASDLAARRLERVLARGGNRHLAIALAGLARELGPERARGTL
jgi:hypothetical protein